jgi:hypothetical protein
MDRQVGIMVYVGTTMAAVPIMRNLFQYYNCKYQRGRGVMWVADPSTRCGGSTHIVQVLVAAALTAMYIPFWLRYSVVGGDASQVKERTDYQASIAVCGDLAGLGAL